MFSFKRLALHNIIKHPLDDGFFYLSEIPLFGIFSFRVYLEIQILSVSLDLEVWKDFSTSLYRGYSSFYMKKNL